MLLSITDGTVTRGGRTVLSHFSFSIRGTEKAAIVGRNGAGKTSLLEIIAGRLDLETDDSRPSSGLVWARACSTGLLSQQTSLDPAQTVGEMLAEAARMGRPEDERFEKETFGREAQYSRMLTAMGFHVRDKSRACGTFSGGEQVRLSLLRLMLEEPEVLLLDEPTNHLDLAAVEFLERYLAAYPHAVVAVSHDRFFIDRFADVVWDVRGGRLFRYPGNYTAFRDARTAEYRKQYEAWRRQQAEIAREEELIETFRHKPKKAAFARARRTMLERMPRVERPDPLEAAIHTGGLLPERPGTRWPVSFDHLRIGYDRPLMELTLRIRRGAKLGIIGPNGAGKSALLRTVAGLLPPLGGHLTMGGHIDTAYFDQMTAAFSDPRTVHDWFHDRSPVLTEKELREKLAGYLFRGRDLSKPVSSLSGGEKSRLALAGILESRPNLLLLDEPTNHMDIPARETMESLFRSYRGTMLIVSHDRYFLQQVADSLLILEPGQREALFYPFGYGHYRRMMDQKADGQSPAAARSLENQRLIDGLRAVPKAEHPRLRPFSTEEETLDWRFELNRREREKAEAAFILLDEAYRKAYAKRSGLPTEEDANRSEFPIEKAAKRPAIPSEKIAEMPAAPVPSLSDWLFSDPGSRAALEELSRRLEEAGRKWTETLLDWYELWLETAPGVPSAGPKPHG